MVEFQDKDGSPIWLNPHHVAAITDSDTDGHSYIWLNNGHAWVVKGTMAEVRDRITKGR